MYAILVLQKEAELFERFLSGPVFGFLFFRNRQFSSKAGVRPGRRSGHGQPVCPRKNGADRSYSGCRRHHYFSGILCFNASGHLRGDSCPALPGERLHGPESQSRSVYRRDCRLPFRRRNRLFRLYCNDGSSASA